MMKKYGTPASEGDIQRAQFLNYLKAPKPLQQAMQHYGHDSDAYRGIQNSMASAQEDMGIRQGTPEPARAWLASQQSPQGQVQAADLVQRTVGGLGPSHPLTQMLNPQAEAERVARRQQSRAEQTPVNARGVAGATFGEVNGQQMLVPQAGHYQEFQGAMAAEGLNGQMGVSRGRFEQARSARVRGQEAGRRQVKKEAAGAAQTAHERELALKTEPARITADASRYTADQTARVNKQKAEAEWRKLFQQETGSFNRTLNREKINYDNEKRTRESIAQLAKMTEAEAVGDKVILPDGQVVPKGRVEEYLLTKKSLRPEFGDFETWAQSRGTNLTPPQMAQWQDQAAPVVQPKTPVAVDPNKTFKSGYTPAQLDAVTDRATAIKRLRDSGDEEGAVYLEGKG